MNPNTPFGRHTGQPSIQLSPRGGESNRLLSLWERIEVRVSRYPDDQEIRSQVRLHHAFVRFAEIFPLLDTGLRRYDVAFLMENPG